MFTLLVVRDPCHERSWFEFCMRSADRIVVLVGPEALPQWALEEPALAGQDLAFVGATFSPAHLRRSLDALRPRAHHLLRVGIDFDGDAARLARRLSGRAVGLVLSGGGARGFAHLGVIERLVEAGIEIDIAGGCSMGAFVAGMFGRGWSSEQMLATTRAELVARKPFNDYTVPRVALIRSRKARSMLARTFGGAELAELPRSTYVVSADLYTGELVVHTRGSLARCVGASMSIPGLVPPLAHDGRLLVDGGLIDNLPIDVMADRHEGPIIAVDVMRRLDAASRPGAPKGPVGALPSIVETLSRATFLGSHERAARNRELSDVLISPDVDDIGLLQFDRIDRAVAAGRTAADRALDDGLRERVDTARR